MAFKHEFDIRGGTWKDLQRVLHAGTYYQMQHPQLLDYFVEPTAKLAALVRGESALVTVEVDAQSVRIQRPLGPRGSKLLEEKLREEYGKRGILAAGLAPADADLVRKICPVANKPIEQLVESSDLAAFDLELKGSLYKPLRNSISHAEREGISVLPYDPAAHRNVAMKIFDEWSAIKPRVGTFWIPKILEDVGSADGMTAMVSIKGKKILGVTIAFVSGTYAYMLLALTRAEHGRSQELVDFEMIRKLKDAGVRRLDWGISDSGSISAYKKKYGSIVREPITTFWIPAKR